ncbi:glycoside hydrolase superfamily [Tuber indicum]|nr:glycoside hydrolase superfamily [Tuber indicum]
MKPLVYGLTLAAMGIMANVLHGSVAPENGIIPSNAVYKNHESAYGSFNRSGLVGNRPLSDKLGIHVFFIGNATIFNPPIGYASAFDPDESLALGITLTHLLAPVLNLSRDLPFGRVEEMFGEDPYPSGELGYSFVKGLRKNGVAATVKNFAGFGTRE